MNITMPTMDITVLTMNFTVAESVFAMWMVRSPLPVW